MQALVWILRFFIVVILVWFALKNSQPIEINGFPGQVWQSPLAFVLLVVFVAGVVIGLLAWVPTVIRQRREIGRLKKAQAQQLAVAAITGQEPPRDALPPRDAATGSDIHGI
jgi:putative membrane protein